MHIVISLFISQFLHLQLVFSFSGQCDIIPPKHAVIKIISKENFSPATDSILKISVHLIDSVINIPAFKESVINAQFQNTKGLSNADIWKLFIKGHETWKPIDNDSIEFKLSIYPDQTGNNIGTTFNSSKITSSESYILKNGAKCYAAHLIHEYCHTIGLDGLGFAHIHNTSAGRKKEKCLSVPYLIGDIARKALQIQTCYFECENFK